MTTVARPQRSEAAHYYSKDGRPQYEIMGKTTGRMRPVTIRDARENGWLPGTSTVLRTLASPGLTAYFVESACLSVLTAPRMEGEELDHFVNRVLNVEKQQEQEGAKARDLGTDIHGGIEQALNGQPYDLSLAVYVEPAVIAIKGFGAVVGTEKIVVGTGYAGKLDVLTRDNRLVTVVDIKTSKSVPKNGSWPEHRLQLSSYAAAIGNTGEYHIQTANLYVSTTNPGEVKLDNHDDWSSTFERGFKPLLSVWQWMNNYFVT